MFDLTGQRVVVTGAAGGIGRALVACFSEAGATVVAFDREARALDELGVAHREAFDLTDAEAARRAVARTIEAVGAPGILINNAGWTRAETLDDAGEESWVREVEVNLTGATRVTRPILDAMVAAGRGAVVFISSVNALIHLGNPAYSAAKAGLLAYARAIAVEHGRDGIRANAICPGSVRTPAWDDRLRQEPGIMERVVRFYPLGRLVEPAEVARTALFLASPAASGITGAAIPVDAGLTAGNLPFVREIIEGAGT